MLELKFNEVEIDGMILKTGFLFHRLLDKDAKVLLLTNYVNDNLEFRKELKITNYEKNNYKTDEEIELHCYKCGTTYQKIGTGRVIKFSENEIIVEPQSIYMGRNNNNNNNNINININNIKDIFKSLNSVIKDDNYLKTNYPKELEKYNNRYDEYIKRIDNDEEKDKYIKGLFRYYYESLLQLFRDNNNYYSIKKLTAMSSYIIAKQFFQNKLNKNVSHPNVFIKDFNIEFDMLLLKENVETNKYVYEIDEVEALVELKSNGIIGYANDDKETNEKYNNRRWFHSYTTFDNNYKIMNENLEKYDKDYGNSEKIITNSYYELKNKINEKDFYYLCFYETNNKNTATYENTYFDIKLAGKQYKGIYFSINDRNDGYTIPLEYEIDSFK